MITHKDFTQLVVAMQCAADYLDLVYEEDQDLNKAAKTYGDRLKEQIAKLWAEYEQHNA